MFLTDRSNQISSILIGQCVNKSTSVLGKFMDRCLAADSLPTCKQLGSLSQPFRWRGGGRKHWKGLQER